MPFQELELERVRYDESAAALIRNQEDLRKRELKIASLEKENEQMKKKIADLEEDLRVGGNTWAFCFECSGACAQCFLEHSLMSISFHCLQHN